jgi:hypothetical protein
MTLAVLGAWISIFLTFAILSYLYDDNPFYKVAEHLFVGTSIGYVVTIQFYDVVKPNLIDRLAASELGAARLVYLVPLALVVCLFMKLTRRWNWLGRLAIAFVIGIYAGQNIPAYASSDLLSQVHVTARAAFGIGTAGVWDALGAVVLVVGLVTSLLYFFFSREHKGALGALSRIGVWVLMIGFGASFGYTVQGRISLAIGRAMEVLDIGRPAAEAARVRGPWASLAAIVVIAAGVWATKRRGRKAG